jgi:crotonobetainyl-CoA:carnitine CoA-transferase CaiB-like acyl-CoA transferase
VQSDIRSLRILELGNTAAVEFAGKLFAGLGASVVRAVLHNTPIGSGAPQIDPASTADYLWYNTGKSALAIDLSQPSESRRLEQLLQSADVVLDGLEPGGLEKMGHDIEGLRADNPAVVVVRVSPFGQSGPYRDFVAEEITLYAMSGLANSTGDGAREPLNAAPRICSAAAGQKAFIAALLALYRRTRTGKGDVVDLSMHETGMDVYEVAIAEFLAIGKVARRNNDEHALVPWRTYPCKDGHALVIGGPMRHWPKAAEVFGAPKLCREFADAGSRMANRKEVEALMKPWLMANDRLTIYHTLQERGLASTYLATVEEALESPQNKARGAFVEIEQPGVGRCTMPDAPFRSSELPWRTAPAPAPQGDKLGVEQLWPQRTTTAAQVKGGASADLPLAGVRVIDFSHDWAGPHAARMLADYGADVIKLECPILLDGMRGGYPAKINDHARFWQLHRNKRSVTLNLKIPEHLEACKKLLASADVVLENSRPGVMDRLGVGYEAMRQLQPKLIFISLSAYGATGPEARYAGYGGAIEAISGLQWVTGYSPSGDRMRVREMDVLNGVFGTCAVVAALLHRDATGRGQWIDLSERETTAWCIGEYFAARTLSGTPAEPQGNRHSQFLQGIYPCAGEDRWVAITVRNDREWAGLLDEIGAADLAADPKLATMAGRRAHQDEIDVRIKAWTTQRGNEEAMLQLQARRVPAGAVFNSKDLAQDPHLHARQWFLKTADGVGLPGYPFRFADIAPRPPSRGPNLGQHNEEILAPLGLPREVWPNLAPQALKTAYHFEF